MIRVKSTLKNLIKLLFWLLVFLIPLIHVSNTKELFEFPKMLFVYGMGSTIIFLYLIGLVLGLLEFRRPPWIITIFFLINVVASVFSLDGYTSLWGYYSRFNGGLISLTVYLGLFVVSASLFNKKFILLLVFGGIISTLIPVSLLGISQYFGWFSSPVERVYSTFGQANWLAAYVSWGLLLSAHKFLIFPFDKKIFVWLSVFLLSFLCFWFTFSMSGILGLCIGFLMLLSLNHKKYHLERLFILAAFVLLISLSFPGLFLFKFRDIFVDLRQIAFNNFYVYAQGEGSQISDPGFIRFGLWRGSLRLVFSNLKNFLVGIGQGCFAYAFPFFRVEALNLSSEWNFILNKPHNYYIEILVETGFVSLILYLWIVLKTFLKRHSQMTPLLGVFLVTNFFGWPTVVTSLYFWILLAAFLGRGNEL